MNKSTCNRFCPPLFAFSELCFVAGSEEYQSNYPIATAEKERQLHTESYPVIYFIDFAYKKKSIFSQILSTFNNLCLDWDEIPNKRRLRFS